MGWAILCNWWYLCKIKNICDGDSANKSGVALAQATPPALRPVEPALIENQPEVIETKAEAPAEEIIPVNDDAPAKADPPSSTFATLFSFDSDKVRIESELSDWLSMMRSRQKEIQQIQIIGHTCELGTDAYNYELGLKRAVAVKRLMIEQGFPGEKIEVASKGKEAPLNANANDQDRGKNRRAEIMIK